MQDHALCSVWSCKLQHANGDIERVEVHGVGQEYSWHPNGLTEYVLTSDLEEACQLPVLPDNQLQEI